MLRSMFSGVSGLRSHQTMVDVIGNNIANVNTFGFKSSTVMFQDLLSQVLAGAGVPTGTTGGTNPAQVGLGVKVAGISTSFTQGASQLTGRSTDLSIQGDGFFAVREGAETLYTRAGALSFDAAGRLVSPDGAIVQGWMADATGAINPNAAAGDLSMPLGQSLAPSPTTTMQLGGNLDASTPLNQPIVTAITVYDQLGAAMSVSGSFTRTGPNTWDFAVDTDADGTFEPAGTLTFDGTTGELQSANPTFTMLAGSFAGPITVDFGAAGTPNSLVQFSGPTSVAALSQDGYSLGALAELHHRAGRHRDRRLLQRPQPGPRPDRAGQLHEPDGAREGGRLDVPPDGQLRAGKRRRGRQRGPGHAARVDARDVERRPRTGVHQPDHRPARLPGELEGHHRQRRAPAGPGQPEAVARRVLTSPVEVCSTRGRQTLPGGRPMPTQLANRPPVPARSISVRRPGLEYPAAAVPKHFVADDIVRSHIAAMLSAVFPEGEDFFVRSVRQYRDQITDPHLQEQVKGFIGQEALHGREHRAFNERLQELGYPTRFVDRRVKAGLALLATVTPKRNQLAVTAALEHYTATLAEVLLRDETARSEFGSDEIRTLFSWHALEETEHKSVAFDVFQHLCGKRHVRVGTMVAVHVGFLVGMSAAVGLSLALDADARRHPGQVLRGLHGLPTHPFFQRSVLRRLRDYNRADFHPDDHDTVELLDHWRAELSGMRTAS